VNRLQDFAAAVEQYLARLSTRERVLVGIAVAVFLSLGLIVIGFSLSGAISRREASIREKGKALQEIWSLAATYKERDARRKQLEEKLRVPVKLFTYIDELSKKQGVEIGDMQDRGNTTGADKVTEAVVEFDLSKLTLDKLTNFLNAIEHGPHILKIKKIRLRTRLDDPNSVDVSLAVATYTVS
jgi:general secretion pathway protein M